MLWCDFDPDNDDISQVSVKVFPGSVNIVQSVDLTNQSLRKQLPKIVLITLNLNMLDEIHQLIRQIKTRLLTYLVSFLGEKDLHQDQKPWNLRPMN